MVIPYFRVVPPSGVRLELSMFCIDAASAKCYVASANKSPAQEHIMTKTTQDMGATAQAAQAAQTAFKSGFEKLQTTGATLAEHGKANLEAVMTATKINMKSLEEAGSIATAHMKSAGEKTGAAMKTLSGAKSLQEVVEVQADFTRNALDSYIADFNKITDVFLGAMKESSKPISERLSASFTAMQSTK
jgi:hypothetical protein